MAKPVIVSETPVNRATSVLDSWSASRWNEWDLAFKEAQRQFDLGIIDYKAAVDAVTASRTAFDAERDARVKRVESLEDALRELHIEENRSVQGQELIKSQKIDELADSAARRKQRAAEFNASEMNEASRVSVQEANDSWKTLVSLATGGTGSGRDDQDDDMDLVENLRELQSLEGLAGPAMEVAQTLALTDAEAFAESLKSQLYDAPPEGTGLTVIDADKRSQLTAEMIHHWAKKAVVDDRYQDYKAAVTAFTKTKAGAAINKDLEEIARSVLDGSGGWGGLSVTTPQGGAGYQSVGVGAVPMVNTSIGAYTPVDDAELRAQIEAAKGDLAAMDPSGIDQAMLEARGLRPTGDMITAARALHAKHFGSKGRATRWAQAVPDPIRMVEYARASTTQRRGGGGDAPTSPGMEGLTSGLNGLAASGVLDAKGRLTGPPVVPTDDPRKQTAAEMVVQAVSLGGPGRRPAPKDVAETLMRSGLSDDVIQWALQHAAHTQMWDRQGGRALPELLK